MNAARAFWPVRPKMALKDPLSIHVAVKSGLMGIVHVVLLDALSLHGAARIQSRNVRDNNERIRVWKITILSFPGFSCVAAGKSEMGLPVMATTSGASAR